MNSVILSGNIGKEPELKNVGESKVISFSLAVKDRFNKDKTNWVNCVGWNSTAEFISKYFSKGSPILISGRLQVRDWEQDGKKRYATEVVIETVDFFGGKKDEVVKKTQNDFVTVDDTDDDLPF